MVSLGAHPLITVFPEVVDEFQRRCVQFQLVPEAQLLLSPLLLEFYHGMHLNCPTVVLRQGSWSLLLVLVLYDHIEVIKSALVLFLQILSHTGGHQLARGQFDSLVNTIRVENVPDLNGVVE